MPLSGVNSKCKKCQKECKQWEQVTVVYCPNYVPLAEKMKEKTLVGEKK